MAGEETLEFQIMKVTTFELPLSRTNEGNQGIQIPSFNLSLTEYTKYGSIRRRDIYGNVIEDTMGSNEEFDHLEITLTIGGDDPRIKAFDIYTEYAGIRTVLIKHAPSHSLWPNGINFYALYPGWDNLQDRMLEVGEIVPTEIREPASYTGASGLRAKSWPLEGSPDGSITIGMCKGSESGNQGGTSYGGPGSPTSLSLDLGHTLEFDPKNMPSGCAIESHNPLCSYTYVYTDYHPIPLCTYQVWAYIDDDLGRPIGANSLESPYGVAFAMYTTEWLKAGKIISKEETSGHLFNYVVLCISSVSNEGGVSWENISVNGVLLNYEIGRWVLLSRKGETDNFAIIPSSARYWEDIVDYLRENFGA